MENSALVLRSRVTEAGAVTVASTCPMAALPWLPHVKGSSLKTCCPACVRRGASHWKILSFTFTARRRWVPVFSAHTAAIGQRFYEYSSKLLFLSQYCCSSRYHWTRTVLSSETSRSLWSSEWSLCESTLPSFLFCGLCHPSRHPHPHPQYSMSFVTICKAEHVRIEFPAEILLSQLFLFTSGLKGDVKIALTQWG